jgi:DNA N-6-adenine-methyltransferase (Dam).
MNESKALFSSISEEWATPQKLFDELDQEFFFTLDPCATEKNAKCSKFYTKKDNGLIQDWSGYRVFVNPPYGRKIKDWVKKCAEEGDKGTLVVLLIPARTDTAYFHDYILNKAEIRFIRGRLRFNDSKQNAPFPSMIVIYNKKKK